MFDEEEISLVATVLMLHRKQNQKIKKSNETPHVNFEYFDIKKGTEKGFEFVFQSNNSFGFCEYRGTIYDLRINQNMDYIKWLITEHQKNNERQIQQ